VILAFTEILTSILYHKRLSLPAAIAHIGLGIMVAGIILSSAGNQTESVSFETNETKSVFGYEVKYLGETLSTENREKYQVFELLNENKTVKAQTKLNATGDDAAREPAIYKTMTGDLYFAPAHKHEQESDSITLKQGHSVTEDVITLTLTDIAMDRSKSSMENIRVNVSLEVKNDKTTETVVLEMINDNGQFKAVPVKILDNTYIISLTGVSAADRQARLELRKVEPEKAPSIDIDISFKPFVWLVWLGCILITFGCLFALGKKFNQAKSE
jgi:cytochrome c-type biogenesis protein CcmF